jgi:hypothetical protein
VHNFVHIFDSEFIKWKLLWRILSFVCNGHWYDSGYVFIEEFFSRLICDCLTFVIVRRIFSWLICDCLTATYNSCFCFDVVLLPISFRHNDRPTDRLSTIERRWQRQWAKVVLIKGAKDVHCSLNNILSWLKNIGI